MLVVWLLATNHAVFELAEIMGHGLAPDLDIGQQRWHQVESSLTHPRTELDSEHTVALHGLPLLDTGVTPLAEAGSHAGISAFRGAAMARAFHTWHFEQRAAPLPGAPATGI